MSDTTSEVKDLPVGLKKHQRPRCWGSLKSTLPLNIELDLSNEEDDDDDDVFGCLVELLGCNCF